MKELDMDSKWQFIAWAFIVAAISISSSFNTYQESQCTIEVAKTGNIDSESIKKICGN